MVEKRVFSECAQPPWPTRMTSGCCGLSLRLPWSRKARRTRHRGRWKRPRYEILDPAQFGCANPRVGRHRGKRKYDPRSGNNAVLPLRIVHGYDRAGIDGSAGVSVSRSGPELAITRVPFPPYHDWRTNMSPPMISPPPTTCKMVTGSPSNTTPTTSATTGTR